MKMLKFIYLTSSSYSGSTLLAFMMGCHPRISTVSELAGIIPGEDADRYLCSCGEKIKICNFWGSVSTRMQKAYEDFSYDNFKTRYVPISDNLIDRLQFSNLRSNMLSDIRDYIYQRIPTYNQYAANITKRNVDLANIILDLTKKDIFFDASKNPKRIKFLAKSLRCEFKVIHLVKDGRGVFDSVKRYRPNISDSDAIHSWKKQNRFIERSLKYVEKQNRYLLLYRDLATNPEREMTKLFDFIGVQYTSKCMDFKNFDHHIIGNTKMRLGSTNEIYYDEKWKTNLSTDQLKLFERLAGKLNRKYGYH